jgi:hypothetical protein
MFWLLIWKSKVQKVLSFHNKKQIVLDTEYVHNHYIAFTYENHSTNTVL